MTMELDGWVVGLVLLAGALHATWNTLVKTGGDRTAVLGLVMGAGAIPWLPFVVVLPPPDPASWPYLLASLTVHMGYYAALLGAYRYGDLSKVYPIARGSAPAMVALGAFLVAGEGLHASEWLGIAIVSLGIVSLAWRRSGDSAGSLIGVGFAALTGASIACYLVIDGLGVRLSGAPVSYIAWLFVTEGVTMTLVVLVLRRRELVATLQSTWARGLAGGLLSTLSYGIAVWAMSLGSMAHVTALRETSVVIAALIGTRLLGEPFGRARVAAAAAVAVGAILVQAT